MRKIMRDEQQSSTFFTSDKSTSEMLDHMYFLALDMHARLKRYVKSLQDSTNSISQEEKEWREKLRKDREQFIKDMGFTDEQLADIHFPKD